MTLLSLIFYHSSVHHPKSLEKGPRYSPLPKVDFVHEDEILKYKNNKILFYQFMGFYFILFYLG